MRSLSLKLTLAFLIVSLGGIALVAVLVWSSTAREFNTLLKERGMNEFVSEMTEYYQTHQSWNGVDAYYRVKRDIRSSDQLSSENNPPASPYLITDPQGRLLVSSELFQVGELFPENQIEKKSEVMINEKVVGYAILTSRSPYPQPFESRFLSRMNQALIYAALGAAGLAVVLGLILTRGITRPVRELTDATSELAQGGLNLQVPVRSKDELGLLTQSFNKMSADLQHANNLRRQMTADIAHELRSPLSVITGYLEGLKDGVLKPTPERFSAMYDEAQFLQRLVEDLRTLSLADAGELSITIQQVQPGEIIERMAAAYQQPAEKKQINLYTEIAQNLPDIDVDPDRIQQVMVNLINNALMYTEAGGTITLGSRCEGDAVLLEVQDSGLGIENDVLPHIFERFFRADNARQDDGSGLGLAIAKSIVEMLGGTIEVFSGDQGSGSKFVIRFPASRQYEQSCSS